MRSFAARRGLPDALPARSAGRSRAQRLRALQRVHGPASRPGRAARRRAHRGGARIRTRAGRGDRAAQALADGRAARRGRKGRIVGCSEGRALAFADDPGWAEALLPLFRARGPAPAPVLDGVVEVLARWRRTWGARPVAVVPMPSALHPQLIRSVA